MNYEFLSNEENFIWNLRQEGKTYKLIGEQIKLSGTRVRQILSKIEYRIKKRTVPIYTQFEMDEIKRKIELYQKELFELRDFAKYQMAKLEALEKTAFYTGKRNI
jgi:hypothetical protein